MGNKIYRLYTEEKPGFNSLAIKLKEDFLKNLEITDLKGVRVLNCYDISGVTDEAYQEGRKRIFVDVPTKWAYDEDFPLAADERAFALSYLPGQYDQRADYAAKSLQIINPDSHPQVMFSQVLVLQGGLDDEAMEKIKDYYINPVDSTEIPLLKPSSLELSTKEPADIPRIEEFIHKTREELTELHQDMGLAMSMEDLVFCQKYFRDQEKRDPTVTEIKVIDTYWSDHCRHTTFFTKIEEIKFVEGDFQVPVSTAYRAYLKSREDVYGFSPKDITLMDMATISMKELRKKGKLPDLDESEEINACSIVAEVDVDGQKEEWLIMFKNETHNHPTEIEPFGGASTCLGGAIRDPLSGRAYVYQAMRVTGSGDPRRKVAETLPGKLPQRRITTEAAAGYSSYGNQIGVAAGQITETYDEGFVAKRMELGALVGAAPRANVVREKPLPGDLVILVGGRTGRDGIGGAVGSSKEHTEDSILTCGAEVQKGNPPVERNIQRLFRKPEVSSLIKRCNDFGAGGVSVAIGELTDGLVIDLDKVPVKYPGLDGTELAISESQERMAVVITHQDAQKFIDYAQEENLEATVVAEVTKAKRMAMTWRGKTIVDLGRDFLNTNGVQQSAAVTIIPPSKEENYFRSLPRDLAADLSDPKESWFHNLQQLNVCSQKGLAEGFDSTAGGGTVLMPFGGKYQRTPAEGMAAKVPVLEGETTTATLMTYGYHPQLAKWSPFHGALYAVVEAVAKIVVMGGDFQKTRLSLQEYFERLGQDQEKWGKPFSGLLGAFYAQKKLGIPAIGGKDSMSGSFHDLHVPPTVVAFAVNVTDVDRITSPEFKKAGSKVVYLPLISDQYEVPDFAALKDTFHKVEELIGQGVVLAATTVKGGGIGEAISKMCFGNGIGFAFWEEMDLESLYLPDHGSIILEVDPEIHLPGVMEGITYEPIGRTTEKPAIFIDEDEISLDEAYEHFARPLADIFPVEAEPLEGAPQELKFNGPYSSRPLVKTLQPQVFMPIFPGTNGEYESVRAWEKAGALVNTLIIKNLTGSEIKESLKEMSERIRKSQIIFLPGGLSAGGEPDGGGKFIAAMFQNPWVEEATMEHLKAKDGLILGIGDGFQALIRLGLVPYGEIRDLQEDSPALAKNKIGRHISCLVRSKVVSNLSPWYQQMQLGDVHTLAVSHGEGQFFATPNLLASLIKKGQIAAQYVDFAGHPSYDIEFNPSGSLEAVEALTSPDGRVLGKMGHPERMTAFTGINVPGAKGQPLFAAGVRFFK